MVSRGEFNNNGASLLSSLEVTERDCHLVRRGDIFELTANARLLALLEVTEIDNPFIQSACISSTRTMI